MAGIDDILAEMETEQEAQNSEASGEGKVSQTDSSTAEQESKESEGGEEGKGKDESSSKEELKSSDPSPDQDSGSDQDSGPGPENPIAEPVQDQSQEQSVSASTAKEIKELRQLLRESRREMSMLKAKLAKVERGIDAEIDSEEGGESGGEETRLEALQREIVAVSKARGEAFSDMVELMELNPKFEDVREVCTRSNFDDILEAAAQNLAAKGERTFEEAILELELSIWKMPNPYKYMYNLIKKFHPLYSAKKAEVEKVKTKGQQKKPVVAPSSVAAAAGGSASEQSVWTAARIDAMEPEELDKVPADIYRRYLAGELK